MGKLHRNTKGIKMREIKFRAFDKEFQEMNYPVLITFDNPIESDNREAIIMQYTGLKDKNGVEIYEGDIVETGFSTAIINYNESTARFCFRRLQKRVKWIENIAIINSYEVIGNIYEQMKLPIGVQELLK